MKLFAPTALAVVLAFPAVAAPNCASVKDATEILRGMYQEEVIAVGKNRQGYLVEWWGNQETGSWTITATRNGRTCIAGQGGAFERVVLQPNV